MSNKVKLCIGPMSKIVVDAILELEKSDRQKVMFIPSRRQIEYSGGYVNNWSTKEFSDYVGGLIKIQRDHGGPGQGQLEDDGSQSYISDSKNFNLIHIDPWKKYQKYSEGLKHTVLAIEELYNLNSSLKFEVGTEESIRRFEEEEFADFISDLRRMLPRDLYNSIEYAVVQSGVGLDLLNMKNTGKFNPKRLRTMIKDCKKNNLLSKEHNGDYLSVEDIKKRFSLGLNTINIAPEFGQIQTNIYIKNMNKEELKEFYKICYNSGKWKKWVNESLIKNESDIIRICGHYVFSDPDFKKIKPNLESKIKSKVKQRVKEIIQIQC